MEKKQTPKIHAIMQQCSHAFPKLWKRIGFGNPAIINLSIIQSKIMEET